MAQRPGIRLVTALRPSSNPRPTPRAGGRWLLPAAAVAALAAVVAILLGLRPATTRAQDVPSRQVTVFGILANPNDATLDAKLKPIAPQLRRLFPGHGFKLLGAETRRIAQGQSVICDLGDGFEAGAQLMSPYDANGKTQLRFELDQDGMIDFARIVSTPTNQLFFLDKRLPDGTRLIIGIGVRE